MQVLEGAFNPDARQRLAEFVNRFKPTFPVGTVDAAFVNNYSQITPDMRPQVPIIFFIDRKGMIRAQYFGQDPIFNLGDTSRNIRAEIDKLLAEPAAPPPQKKPSASKKKQ